MEILVTGGAGFIGSHTCVELIQRGYDVVIIDNFVNSSKKSLERIREITGVMPVLYEADVRDEAVLSKIFNEHEIGCVIHFAGLKAVGESVAQPLRYYGNNLGSTIALCNAMRRNSVKKLIFSSSATVYALGAEPPFSEESQTGGCTNPYGWTKYFGEQIIRDAAKAEGDWSVALLRYFNPVGAHRSGLIGEDPKGIPNNLMPFICQVASGRREKLNIFGNDYPTPDGTGVRDYIHVVDLALGHVAAIDYLSKNVGEAVFNLGTGRGCSVLEMVRAFERVNGIKIPYEIVGRRPGDLAVSFTKTDKSAEVLGWKAELGLEEMCRDAWNWQKQNPNGYNDL
ncbi:UDP-glucose 4-epimerase GalE [bacterium]|nr:UDP-glucose 4-epimerase GalE [bacterium]